MFARTSPLVDVGMAHLHPDSSIYLTKETRDSARSIMTRFVTGEISHSEARSVMQSLVGSPTSIDKLFEVLTVPDEPIPLNTHLACGSEFSSQRHKTQPWTTQEDTRLLAAIHKFGLELWPSVAQFVGNGRTRSQCSQRWIRGLDPRISKDQWTREDEDRLCRLVEQYGQKSWMRIASDLGNRADVQCRYHFMQMQRGAQVKPRIPAAPSRPPLPVPPIIPREKPAVPPPPSLTEAVLADLGNVSVGSAENLPLDAAKGPRRADPLFSSDFWVI
jgi:hypothetical protein